MPHRLEIELTSERPDGTWTWRAAGARQPKGEMDGSLLPGGAKVGDVLRAEAEFLLDGIEIVAVLPPKPTRREPQLLEIRGSGREEPLVTTQLARRPRDGERRRPRDGDRGARRERAERPQARRPAPVPERPRPKRLRPGRAHRNAVLEELPPEQRPIAEQVLRGGVPAVREAIAKQNAEARRQNQPEVPADQLVAMAEELLPRLRAAEWKDRAEAALRDLEDLDLRDLRSVVVAADGVARDDESRALVAELRAGLSRRVEEEHGRWLDDISANLDAGRFVRALRLSSRPPKAGAPLPPELAGRLVAAVAEGLNERTNRELWAAALDALAYSPVRTQVVPASRPAEPGEELLEAVRRVADRLPKVAALFGVDPSEATEARRRRPSRGRAAAPAAGGSRPERPPAPSPTTPAPEPRAAVAPASSAVPDEPASADEAE